MSLQTVEDLLQSPTLAQDPYPVYKRLRELPGAYYSPAWGRWVVTHYDAVVEAMRGHGDLSSAGWEQQVLAELPVTEAEPLSALRRHYETRVINNSDPPEHTRFRKMVVSSFTPKALEALRPRIVEVVDELVGNLKPGLNDVLGEFFYPLPAIVLAELLGVPAEDSRVVESWSADIVAFLGSGTPSIDRAWAADHSIAEFAGYLTSMIESRSDARSNDLLEVLMTAGSGEEALSMSELIATCVTLLFAGHETTANLLGNGLLSLLDNPEQLQLLVSNPGLADQATEELLRFDSPVQRVRRTARADIELDGTRISEGQQIMAFIGSANRDESRFRDADRLDITRSDGGHVSFGHGVHFCLGAGLSRIEAPIALQALFDRFPDIRLGPEQPRYKNNLVFRGLDSLVVELR
jgi:cytochrome P450